MKRQAGLAMTALTCSLAITFSVAPMTAFGRPPVKTGGGAVKSVAEGHQAEAKAMETLRKQLDEAARGKILDPKVSGEWGKMTDEYSDVSKQLDQRDLDPTKKAALEKQKADLDKKLTSS